MRIAFHLGLLLFVSSSASAQVIDTTRPVALRTADRAAIEKAACADTGKPVLSIRSWRNVKPGIDELSASVLCEDAVENDVYRAYFYRPCTKKGGRWMCFPPTIQLDTEVAGEGLYQISVRGLSLDEALAGLACLEAVFAQNPKTLNGARPGNSISLHAGPLESGRPYIASLEVSNECYWFEYPRQCRADGAEPVPVEVATGCIDE